MHIRVCSSITCISSDIATFSLALQPWKRVRVSMNSLCLYCECGLISARKGKKPEGKERLGMAVTEEPILSGLDRLDNMVRQVEEIRGGNRSPKSSSASTPSTGTFASEGHCSSFDLSPKSIEKHCLPINRVMGDIELKGTLVQRIDHLEQRFLKMCMQLEGEIEAERKREEKNEKSGKNKGFRGLVRRMVKGNKKNHQTHHR